MKRTLSRRPRNPQRQGAAEGVQPVLDAIARTAARLCEARDALIYQVEGDNLQLVAKYGRLRAARDVGDTMPLGPGWVVGRTVIDRKPVHVHDLTRAAKTEFSESRVARGVTASSVTCSPRVDSR